MRRHSLPPSPRPVRASGDRWLFGYADVVTLLFACFASLYAAKIAPPVSAAAAVRDIRLDLELSAARQALELRRELQSIATDDRGGASMEVGASTRGLVLSLAEAGSFPAGRADLTPEATDVMLTVAAALRRLPNLIRVEGHTDDAPIRTPLFASNWELSTARATRVVQLLIERGGIDPGRLSAAGYAEYRPRVSNASTETRARNRRVDIVVLDAAAARAEEPGAARP
jgi:chemotaxis protein MotB